MRNAPEPSDCRWSLPRRAPYARWRVTLACAALVAGCGMAPVRTDDARSHRARARPGKSRGPARTRLHAAGRGAVGLPPDADGIVFPRCARGARQAGDPLARHPVLPDQQRQDGPPAAPQRPRRGVARRARAPHRRRPLHDRRRRAVHRPRGVSQRRSAALQSVLLRSRRAAVASTWRRCRISRGSTVACTTSSSSPTARSW